MNTRTRIIAAALTLGTLAAPATVHADSYDNPDNICYARTDMPGRTVVAVVDTWRSTFTYEINYGTEPNAMPCVPTDCPEPLHLISGNVCSTRDPFEHLPMEDEPARAVDVGQTAIGEPASSGPAEISIDVGDLVEPFAPAGYKP